MNFQQMMDDLKLCEGDFFSVTGWIDSIDRSYIGQAFKIVAISQPFIRALHMDGYNKGRKSTFSLDQVQIIKLNEAFVADIIGDERQKDKA